LESPEDQRAVFCLPWKDKTLVGTTELLYNDVPDNSLPTKPEIDYLCDTVKYYFPKVNFVVESSFSGLRVLPTSTKKAFLRPRDTLLHNEDNIISLYGGKLTAWRATGMKVLQLIDLSFDKKSSLDEDNLLV
jgi:glycerol-3-phosphate dehydrogenase